MTSWCLHARCHYRFLFNIESQRTDFGILILSKQPKMCTISSQIKIHRFWLFRTNYVWRTGGYGQFMMGQKDVKNWTSELNPHGPFRLLHRQDPDSECLETLCGMIECRYHSLDCILHLYLWLYSLRLFRDVITNVRERRDEARERNCIHTRLMAVKTELDM